MNKQQVMEKLNLIFVDLFDDDSIVITDATTANDIEDWDSLTYLEMISLIENEFKIHFLLGEINNFANVGEMCDCIMRHISKD